MPSVPPASPSNPTPPPGATSFRLVAPDSGDSVPNTDNVRTVISSSSGNGEDWDKLPGQHLAHYEVLEPIGSGGMATVFRAKDENLGRTVALKILPRQSANDPELLARFRQEALSAARLNDDRIARVYFFGEDRGINFIAFEYIEGLNLRQVIDSRGPLPEAEAARLILEVAQGLAHAVSRNVVHRDLKPSNIIVDPHGHAKIVDMGLARRLDVQADHLTQSGVTLGTFDYVAPEQAIHPRDADVRSDIYSLGCTFYHALTGQAPVPEGTAAFKLHHHQHVQPADPRSFRPNLHGEVVDILVRMMHKSPEMRYQTPQELIEDLTHVTLILNSDRHEVELSRARVSRSNLPRWAFATVLSAAVIVVICLVAFVHFQSSPDPAVPGKLIPSRATTVPGTSSTSVERNN
ncbi:MAG: serine/threonine-protein kinase [Gemmataceae bacterium]